MQKEIINQNQLSGALRGQIEAGTYFATLAKTLKLSCATGAKLRQLAKSLEPIILDLEKLQKEYKIVKIKI